jgi:hypothetical protein
VERVKSGVARLFSSPSICRWMDDGVVDRLRAAPEKLPDRTTSINTAKCSANLKSVIFARYAKVLMTCNG